MSCEGWKKLSSKVSLGKLSLSKLSLRKLSLSKLSLRKLSLWHFLWRVQLKHILPLWIPEPRWLTASLSVELSLRRGPSGGDFLNVLILEGSKFWIILIIIIFGKVFFFICTITEVKIVTALWCTWKGFFKLMSKTLFKELPVKSPIKTHPTSLNSRAQMTDSLTFCLNSL